MTAARQVTIVIELVVAVSALVGVVLANAGRDNDLKRLDENQASLYEALAAKTAEIESLKSSQEQMHSHILRLYEQQGASPQVPVSVDNSGNIVTETADYALGLPKRAAKEAERFLDRINPF